MQSGLIGVVLLGLGSVLAGCAGGDGRESAAVEESRVVLFDGTTTDAWIQQNGTPCGWAVEDGEMRVRLGGGSIQTKERFQSFNMHIEFNVPVMADEKSGQNRGNSGVYLQRRYELQILDSYGMEPAADLCGGLYRLRAPDVNAAKPAGEWQTYDIDFTAPTWDEPGEKVNNARITVVHNGIVIHDDAEVERKTGAGQPEGPEPGPIMLQDHGAEVAFRNIWIVPK